MGMCAGNQPVPAPAQAVAANFANAIAPGVNSLTQSLMELIPSPPPPPPPPTVIQALAPLEQVRAFPSVNVPTTRCSPWLSLLTDNLQLVGNDFGIYVEAVAWFQFRPQPWVI